MNVNKDLSVAWSSIDGEGLVRVVPVESFKTGFIVLASIGQAGENLGYYPEVTLSSTKLIITMPEDTDGRDHELARQIDQLLGDGPEQDEKQSEEQPEESRTDT